MAWRDWSYWLKGGVISAAIFLMVATLLFALEIVLQLKALEFIDLIIIRLLPAIIFGFANSFLLGRSVVISAPLILLADGIVIWFTIGAIIGFIYGKIKSSR